MLDSGGGGGGVVAYKGASSQAAPYVNTEREPFRAWSHALRALSQRNAMHASMPHSCGVHIQQIRVVYSGRFLAVVYILGAIQSWSLSSFYGHEIDASSLGGPLFGR